MNKKIFLISAIAMCIACPSFAEEFPADGYMQENKTYDNAATEGNMDGVYEGSVNAIADYDDILYTIGAGKYLAAGGTEIIDCNVSGSFCPGLQSQVTYNANNAQGLTSCSDATSGAYTLSDGTGSTADSCYRTCSGNVTIEHATAVSGNDYYGNGVDTCEPTACVNGYHVKTTPDLLTIIGETQTGTDLAAIDNAGNDKRDNASTFGLSLNDHNSFIVDYGTKGKIYGHGRCSTKFTHGLYSTAQTSEEVEVSNDVPENFETGYNCWCKLDGYIPNNGNLQNISTSWIAGDSFGGCDNDCSYFCGDLLKGTYFTSDRFRVAVFSAIEQELASCAANTINITWDGATAASVSANNAGQCRYGGDIRTPVAATVKPGKTFKGWKFVKPFNPASPEEP